MPSTDYPTLKDIPSLVVFKYPDPPPQMTSTEQLPLHESSSHEFPTKDFFLTTNCPIFTKLPPTPYKKKISLPTTYTNDLLLYLPMQYLHKSVSSNAERKMMIF